MEKTSLGGKKKRSIIELSNSNTNFTSVVVTSTSVFLYCQPYVVSSFSTRSQGGENVVSNV